MNAGSATSVQVTRPTRTRNANLISSNLTSSKQTTRPPGDRFRGPTLRSTSRAYPKTCLHRITIHGPGACLMKQACHRRPSKLDLARSALGATIPQISGWATLQGFMILFEMSRSAMNRQVPLLDAHCSDMKQISELFVSLLVGISAFPPIVDLSSFRTCIHLHLHFLYLVDLFQILACECLHSWRISICLLLF